MCSSDLSFLSKKIKRKTLLNSFTFITCSAYLLFFAMVFIHPRNPDIKNALLINSIILNILGFIIFFGQGLINMLIIVMLNNTIEYDEFKFNERHDSIISTVRSFTAKLGGAISQGFVNLTLILSGLYSISQRIGSLESLAGAGEITKEEVLLQADIEITMASNLNLLILRICITFIPIAALLTSLFIINKKYKIDEEEYERLVTEIKNRS